MAKLLFYDNDHTYEADGVKQSSVSEILRFLSKEEYGDVEQYRLDHAAQRGTAVHTACEVLYKYKKVECDPDIEPYVLAFVQFLKDRKCSFTDIEKPLADTEMGFAGTPDLCGTVDGEEAIIDMKTVSAIHKTLVKAQLNAYRHLRIKNGKPEAKKLFCLHLMNTGKYRLYPVAIDDTEWQACYALHTALKEKQPRVGIV